MKWRKVSISRLLVIIILIIFCITLVNSKDETKGVARIILESSWPTVIIWILAIISVSAGKFYGQPNMNNPTGLIYQSFGGYADSVFTIATYGLSGSTSLALLKGLHLQLFFGGAFFIGFGDFDLASIFIISSFLLFYSVVSTMRQIIKVVLHAEATEVTSA